MGGADEGKTSQYELSMVGVTTSHELTSDDQRADDTRPEFGGLVDEGLRDEVGQSNDKGPHAELVCSV